MQHVFVVGSKGIPSAYGGYETFVDKLTQYHKNSDTIKYHVACKNQEEEEISYNNARCFNVSVPNIGPAQAIYYDVKALRKCVKYIKKKNVKHPIVYILACRISIFAKYYQRKIHKLGGRLLVNPDGHEWKRSKWSKPVRWYWKFSEKAMVKHADLLVCDSKNIEKYIHDEYRKYNPKTTFIAYGAEEKITDKMEAKREILDSELASWLKEKELEKNKYYLIVGRFVPENNYETMIREFMSSNTDKKLAIITTENETLYKELNDKLDFEKDERIKFVGTVYDKDLLSEIRSNAYGYLHGHEVGGTNPSLLEALATTGLNLLLDVGFNREVGVDAALYWNKKKGYLAKLIDKCDTISRNKYDDISNRAKQRIKDAYSWPFIASEYEKLWEKR